jgi:hypothetical protein
MLPSRTAVPQMRRQSSRSKGGGRARPVTQLDLPFRAWGGRRPGAGRKPKGQRAGVPHTARPVHQARHPVHVTLRAVRRLPSLRRQLVFLEIHGALARCSTTSFRVVHFSVRRITSIRSSRRMTKRCFARGARTQVRLARGESGSSAQWTGVGRSLPRAAAFDAARSTPRARLCAHELAKARAWRTRVRPLHLRLLVRWVASLTSCAATKGRARAARSTCSNPARVRGVAPLRTGGCPRTAP